MTTFQSKPRLIEAEQFFHDKPLPFQRKGPYVGFGCNCGERDRCPFCGRFWVLTAHGRRVTLVDGDWVVPEPQGPSVPSFAAYPITPDIFDQTYVIVAEE